jgi:uncharacterized protein involved in exopolysaccharide biosynthesis
MNLPARSTPPEGENPPVALSQRAYAIQRASPAALGDPRALYQDDAPVFVLANLRVAAGFPQRSVARHRKLAAALFTGLLGLVALAIFVTPKHYTVETKFFAEKNFVMPALGNPKRAVPTESDSPTRLASEAVLKRTNLMEIVRQTKLMASWDEMRSPLGKVKDAIMARIKGPMTEADRLEAMLGMVEKRMWVYSNDGTVTIGLDWPNPALGYRIVQAAQQNFFEQRHASEVSLIGESIGILEGHVASSQVAIQEALAQINAQLPKRAAVSLPIVSRYSAPAAAPSIPPAVVALQSDLRTKQQTIADISSSRNQRLSALQTRLTELRGVYGSAHPEIAVTEENIRSLNQPSAQLAELKREEEEMRARLATMGAGREVVAAPAQFQPSFERAALERLTRAAADTQEAPEVTFARSRLKIATSDYEDLLDRLEGAKIEMETARAAFKYRYSVITPARIPKKPKKPVVPLMIFGGLILAALATAFTVIMMDFGGGRVLEPWQVDRQLGVPVLAEVRRR